MSFEDELWHCTLDQKIFYSDWHRQDPTLTFHAMLRILADVRHEQEVEDWKRHLDDEAYFNKEEERLLAEEAERFEEERLLAEEAEWLEEEQSMGEIIELPEPLAPLQEEPELVDEKEAEELFATLWRFLEE